MKTYKKIYIGRRSDADKNENNWKTNNFFFFSFAYFICSEFTRIIQVNLCAKKSVLFLIEWKKKKINRRRIRKMMKNEIQILLSGFHSHRKHVLLAKSKYQKSKKAKSKKKTNHSQHRSCAKFVSSHDESFLFFVFGDSRLLNILITN